MVEVAPSHKSLAPGHLAGQGGPWPPGQGGQGEHLCGGQEGPRLEVVQEASHDPDVVPQDSAGLGLPPGGQAGQGGPGGGVGGQTEV